MKEASRKTLDMSSSVISSDLLVLRKRTNEESINFKGAKRRNEEIPIRNGRIKKPRIDNILSSYEVEKMFTKVRSSPSKTAAGNEIL